MNAAECIAVMQSEIPGFVALSSVTFQDYGDIKKGFVFGYTIWEQDANANTTKLIMYVAQFVNGSNRITDTSLKTYRLRYGDDAYEWQATVADTTADLPGGWKYRLNGNYFTVPNDKPLVFRLWVNLNTGSFTTTQCETTKLFSVERRSTLNVPSLTLGSASTLTISRKTSAATHTVKYRASGASTWTDIVANTSATSVSWTPPMDIANSSPGSVYAPVTIRLLTYTDSGWGSYDYDVNILIPTSVRPTVTNTVSDGNGYAAIFGKYLHNKSTYAVAVTATPAYGSAIVSYSTVISGQTINGNAFNATYTGSTFTTDILQLVGTVTITTSVTDARGRVGTATKTVTAIQYTPPLITALSVHRCSADGTENDQGEYVSFAFSAVVQALSNINTAQYWYKYKSSAASSYTTVALSSLANQYTVTNYTVIIPADSSYTYDIVVSVQDRVMTTEQSVQASTAATILNLHNSGTGMGIGKVAEAGNLLDVGWPARFRGSTIFDGSIYSGGVVGSVTRTVGSLGYNATIIGQCFCTCLGNGKFRFDVSGKWTVSDSTTAHNYGISKDFLRRAVYNNLYGNTNNLANLNYVGDGECLVFSATDYTYGHPNVDYGWAVQAQTNSFCLSRIYNTSGANGGWESSVVKPAFPSGFYFKATIWASLA